MKFYESWAALTQDMGVPVSKMEESIEACIQASLKTAQDLDGGPYPAFASDKSWSVKLLARWVQDGSFTTTSLREPISQRVDGDTVDHPGWDGEPMDNAFVFARHVHGGQLLLHRNKGGLQGFESQRQLAQGSITDTKTCPKLTGELRCRQW